MPHHFAARARFSARSTGIGLFINSEGTGRRMKRGELVSFLVILFLIAPAATTSISPATPSGHISRSTTSSQNTEVDRNWTIRFVLLNYLPSQVNTTSLVSSLPTERIHNADPITINYHLNYIVEFASESYVEQVRQFILGNSINGTGTGTRLDASALSYQKDHVNEPQRIFYPRDGRSIDGQALEDWFAQNPYGQPPGLGYMFYLLNFSEFDTADHSLEHWYNYSPVDPDTGQNQDWFRLEWDNALNPNVTLEYPGFGGRYNIYVLDPSADQWYLKWARIWWGTHTDYEYMSIDLDQKVQSLDLMTQTGVNALAAYLAEYIYDPVTMLMAPRSPMSNQNDVAPYVQRGYLKSLVFCMDVAQGISVDSLRWVTDADIQKAHLEELFPFIHWEVDVEFVDIDNSPAWKNLFWNYAQLLNGKTIVDGGNMFNAIYSTMRGQYIDINDKNTNVFGVVFIKKNMEMYYGGRQYTGLGGDGQTVIWKSWERYYRSDGVTPKSGISGVQLHETGHAIGLGHTWRQDHYVGDFSYNVMGYHGAFNGTGKFEQNWVQSTYLDQMQGRLWLHYQETMSGVDSNGNPRAQRAEQEVLKAFDAARNQYNSMNWAGCYSALQDVEQWIETLSWTITDDTAPTIVSWGIQGEPLLTNATVWTTVIDDISGIENVSVFVKIGDFAPSVFRCSHASGNWTTTIPQIPTDINVRIWVEAQDKAMNLAVSDVEVFAGGFPPGYNPLLDPVVIGGITVSVVAIAAIVVVARRRRLVQSAMP